jgi:hypothetical protein
VSASTVSLDRAVAKRQRDRALAESAIQRSVIEGEILAERAAEKNAAERRKRAAKGEAAMLAVRGEAPVVSFKIGKITGALVLGSGDSVVSATTTNSVTKLATVLTSLHRARVMQAGTSGEVPPLNVDAILRAIDTAVSYSQKQGTAATRIETE